MCTIACWKTNATEISTFHKYFKQSQKWSIQSSFVIGWTICQFGCGISLVFFEYILSRRLEFSIRKSRHKIINLVIWCDFKHVWTPLCGATPSQQPEKILSFFINIVPGMNESWSCNELLFTFFCSSWFMSPGPVVNLGLKLFPARRFLIWV